MTAWATIRRFGFAIALLGTIAAPSRAADPPVRPVKPTPVQLRDAAEKAEKAGDWEAAFNAYCHLFVADRAQPELRDRLNATLRHVHQVRRHRDPSFQQFAAGMTALAALDLFTEVIQRVPGMYADREKATPQNLWNHAIEELDRALAKPTFLDTYLDNPKPQKVASFRAELRRDWAKRSVTDYKIARETMRDLVAAAKDAFALRVPSALAVEAACGACSGLDEYTVFLTPTTPGVPGAAVPDLTAAGLYLASAKDGVAIQGIVPNSWFAHTFKNVERGGIVTKINGRAVPTLAAAAEALRSPGLDGFHQLEVRSATEVPVVARIPVLVPTVYGTRLMNPKEIGYARIGTFTPTTPRELDAALNHLKAEGARVIVLDLRGNHGGSFLAGVDTARRLLPAGLIVTTQGQASDVDNRVFSSMSGMSAHDVKVVLLIDAETASAAEVVAAALKDNDRATLVGMPTFGKGTMQYPMRLVTLDDVDPATGKRIPKTGTVRVTIAKLVAPRSGPINGVGVVPHFLEADAAQQLELAVEKAVELLPIAMPQPAFPPLDPIP